MKVILLTSLAVIALGLAFKPGSRIPDPPMVTEKFDPKLAQARAVSAAQLGATPAVSTAEAGTLAAGDVEKRIGEIDAYIESHGLVEKSNRGALDAQELIELRRLLGLRNAYFTRKLDLEYGGES